MNAISTVSGTPVQPMWSPGVTKSIYAMVPSRPPRPMPGASLGQTTPQGWSQIANFYRAFILGLDFAYEMVADDAMDPPNPQVWEQAIDAMVGFAGHVPLPLVTPLQLGGVSVEWHEHDIDLEVRFRPGVPPFVSVDDVRGLCAAFQGHDKNLVNALSALTTLATRTA